MAVSDDRPTRPRTSPATSAGHPSAPSGLVMLRAIRVASHPATLKPDDRSSVRLLSVNSRRLPPPRAFVSAPDSPEFNAPSRRVTAAVSPNDGLRIRVPSSWPVVARPQGRSLAWLGCCLGGRKSRVQYGGERSSGAGAAGDADSEGAAPQVAGALRDHGHVPHGLCGAGDRGETRALRWHPGEAVRHEGMSAGRGSQAPPRRGPWITLTPAQSWSRAGTRVDVGGNLQLAPQLEGTRLGPTSPLSTGTCAGAPSTDIDGDPRPTGDGWRH
jgi:hypothetical protein